MKHLLLYVVAVLLCAPSFATIYYSQGSISPTTLSSWNTNRTGGGAAPSSFTISGDEFIIQAGDNMIAAQSWTLGDGVTLHIEGTGSLEANQGIDVPGTFQIDDGGTYIHNNTAAPITNGIFGGTATFAAGATVEIRNWINSQTSLPSGIAWGNLVIDYTRNLGDWSQEGNLSSIQGNLILNNTGGSSFILTSNNVQDLTIGGNLEVNGGGLVVKSAADDNSASLVQVNGNITIVDGSLNVGTVQSAPNNELRFKGNFDLSGTGSITSTDIQPFLVANGDAQSFSIIGSLDCSFKVMPKSQLSVNSDLTLGIGKFMVISGQVTMNLNQLTVQEGLIAVAGGDLLIDGTTNLNNTTCQVCSGDGTLGSSNWCKQSGTDITPGKITISNTIVSMSQSDLGILIIGGMNSPGQLFLENSTISFTGDPAPYDFSLGDIELEQGSTLGFDSESKIEGEAFYNGNGGSLIIGSADGITLADLSGNIIVSGGRNYNAFGANSFEYASSEIQVTGDGLPTTMTGTLKINNTSSGGVTLTAPDTIKSNGSLELTNGVLLSNQNLFVTIDNGASATGGSSTSYVEGPLRKVGNTDFVFPIGKSGVYSPVSMSSADASDLPTDGYTAEYFPANPKTVYAGEVIMMDHISTAEYWIVKPDNGQTATRKRIGLTVNPRSRVSDPNQLVVALFDGSDWLDYGQDSYTGTAQNGVISFLTDFFQPVTLGTLTSVNVLPVKLLSFNAVKQNGKGKLTWEIAKDERADHFEILRSVDKENFISISTVPAVTGRYEYSLNDVNLPAGTSYYRLKITGADGSVTFSRVVALMTDNSGFTIVSANPTRVSGTTNINLSSSEADRIHFVMTNIQGQIVRNFTANVREGSNLIPVDCSRLSVGLYNVSAVNSKGQRSTIRIIKM